MIATPRTAAWLAALGLAALPCLAMTSCSSVPTECGGQCTAPYELDVAFRPSTTKPVAQQTIARCANSPTVVRVAALQRATTGQWQGRIYTTKLGRSAATQALLTCLDGQQAVVGAAWPD
jgi:hypothetical protein